MTHAVEVAVSRGFRHFDSAMFYGTEAEVGAGIAASMKKYNLRREDFFITSKVLLHLLEHCCCLRVALV